MNIFQASIVVSSILVTACNGAGPNYEPQRRIEKSGSALEKSGSANSILPSNDSNLPTPTPTLSSSPSPSNQDVNNNGNQTVSNIIGVTNSDPYYGTQKKSASDVIPANPVYSPTIGDRTVYRSRQKFWASSDPGEAGFWNASDATFTADITKIYDISNRVAYRKNAKMIFDYKANKPGNVYDKGSFIDYGLDAGAYCGAPACSEYPLASQDIGMFIGSKGRRTVCDIVSCLNSDNTKTFSRIETLTYQHTLALNERLVVNESSYTCAMRMAADASTSGVDPCKPNLTIGQKTSYARTSFELQDQTAATSSNQPKSVYIPRSSFSYGSQLSGISSSSFGAAICSTQSNKKLTIFMPRILCNNLWSGSESLEISDITPMKSDILVGPKKLELHTQTRPNSSPADTRMCLSGSYAYYQLTFFNSSTINCTVKLMGNRGENILYGNGSCDKDLIHDGYAPTKLNNFDFVCDAPDNFDFNVFN